MVEMLASTVVLMLLALLLNTGLQMTMNTYQTAIANSETELLLSTVVNALTDELRYARNVTTTGDGKLDTYTSYSFGENTKLEIAGPTNQLSGQIIATSNSFNDPQQVLSTGAYGKDNSYKKYKVTEMDIECSGSTFIITLTVTDGKISAGTTVTVRCLNPTA